MARAQALSPLEGNCHRREAAVRAARAACLRIGSARGLPAADADRDARRRTAARCVEWTCGSEGRAVHPLALDVYPHADVAVRPLALVLRGGTGTVGQRSSYVGQLVELFGDAGYVVATTDYRSQSLDASAEDLTAALSLLTMCHASALKVAQYKVVLVTEDSAAPAALLVAGRLQELRLGRFARRAGDAGCGHRGRWAVRQCAGPASGPVSSMASPTVRCRSLRRMRCASAPRLHVTSSR